MTGLSVEKRLFNLRQRIQIACARSGRPQESVQLLAVSKLQDSQRIREALACGQRDFAENYVQEAAEKQAQLENSVLRWHFIGRIQSNKVKQLTGKFEAIHSVDRARILQLLNSQGAALGVVQKIFLQYNVANESSKAGAGDAELGELMESLRSSTHLSALGLMVMPPLSENPEDSRTHFVRARATLARLEAGLRMRSENPFLSEERARHPFNQLSMGTSHDFEVAIEEGATWVRIGSELFGPRGPQ